jgi:hypothetical protein
MGRFRDGCRIESEIKLGFREKNAIGFWGKSCVRRGMRGCLAVHHAVIGLTRILAFVIKLF